MATQADVRRIARALPDTEETKGRFAFSVRQKDKLKGFAWVWMERIEPKKPRVANPGVLAVRVANVSHRDLMIAAEPKKFFTEPHYNGFPAVLVRLDAVSVSDLRQLLADGWSCHNPQRRDAAKGGDAAKGQVTARRGSTRKGRGPAKAKKATRPRASSGRSAATGVRG